ncbi:MAG: hypothetical protein WC782_11595 [Methylococcaceae bacterium]|jgi:hypothetical protein
MNTRQTFAAAAMALAMFSTSVAQAASNIPETTLRNFFLNSTGTGLAGATLIENFIDLTGLAYVNNTFTSDLTFNFREAANFSERTADSVTDIDPILRATFVGTGTGTAGGLLTFDQGTLTLTERNGTPFANFQLLEGTANLIANSTIPQGTVSLIFQATSLASGYFFDSNGNDLSSAADISILFGLSTTNALPADSNTTINPALVTLFNNSFDPDVSPTTSNGITDVQFSTNGQFRLATVPVPGAFWLLGSGLLGLATAANRRKKLAA